MLPIQLFSTALPQSFGFPDLQPSWSTDGVESKWYLTVLHYAKCWLIYESRSVQMT